MGKVHQHLPSSIQVTTRTNEFPGMFGWQGSKLNGPAKNKYHPVNIHHLF